MQKVLSPSPNTEYSPNCPAENWKDSATCGSWKVSLNVRVSGVSSVISAMRMRCGW